MFYISATHSLQKQFTRELCDAFFIPDEEDHQRINAWVAQQNPLQTYKNLHNSSPCWVHQHCKHIIPPPNILYSIVARVFQTYGHLPNPMTKKPLFTPDNWKTANCVLDLIKKGFLSDVPSIALYTIIGVDKNAGHLPIY